MIGTDAQDRSHRRAHPARRSLLPGLGWAALLVAVSLAAGMAGYSWFENLGPVDAFLNAAMILGGMGPVATLTSSGGKIFAGIYALYSGLVVLVIAGLMLGPIVHNVLHRFHMDDGDR